MTNDELLQELSIKLGTGELRAEEVSSRLGLSGVVTSQTQHTAAKTSIFTVTNILYVLGAAIVVIGVIIFVSQIWDDISSVGRIGVTLGFGLLMAAMGSVLLTQRPQEHIGSVFHCIGGVLIPGGALVTLSELHSDISSVWPVAFVFGAIYIFYSLLNRVHKNPILMLFVIANGTAFVYLLISAMIEYTPYREDDVFSYVTMILGASYLLLAQSFREGVNNKLVGALHFFGVTGFLGAAFTRVFDSGLWQLAYFVIVMAGIALAVYMKSRIILVMSTIFMIVHVAYITDEYFADSLGWPISLVILGFIFIGLGFASIRINNKYIAD